MRTAVVATAVLLLLSGCLGLEKTLGEDGEEKPLEISQVHEETLPALPEDVERTIDIIAGFDIPPPEGEEEFCWMPSNACEREPFTIPDDAPPILMRAELSWDLEPNNLGLFLYEGDQDLVYDSGPFDAGTSRSLDYTFDSGGEYSIVVDPHWSGPETARLTISFEWA